MTKDRSAELADRQARLAQITTRHRRAERRRTLLISLVTGVVLVGLIGTTAVVLIRQNNKNTEAAALAKSPITGVRTFPGLGRDHVEGTVAYPQDPPVGGDHSAVDQNCGYYSVPIKDENAVHSLEHGAVWITHAPDLAAVELATLRSLAGTNSYLLVSPRENLPSPVVLSAWGVQLQVDSVDDARVAAFVRTYVNGPQTPEPGAACSGGTGTPE